MSSRPGCFRPALFGCLGMMGILVLVVLVGLVMAWRGVQQRDVADGVVATPEITDTPALAARAPGQVILELEAGEFHVLPADSGAGVSVRARFDRASHVLEDSLEVQADGTWIYRVSYRPTVSMLQGMLRSLIGGQTESRVEVRLPPDLPIALRVQGVRGGAEIDLGGLWLTDADISFRMGGAEVAISEPLHEPLPRLRLRSTMGGLEVTDLGNASPRALHVATRMGGAALDLRGPWAGDCTAQLEVQMGGLAIATGGAVAMQPEVQRPQLPREGGGEVSGATVWYRASTRMGEIDIQ
jgi:hypothetical protein